MALRVSSCWPSRWVPAGFVVAVFLIATLAFNHRIIGGDQYDDAYIAYRYAHNLAIGKGLVFNSYERINSISSFLYTMILAGTYRLGVHDLELFAALFGLAMGSLLVAMTFLMACAATGSQRGALMFTLPLCVAGSIGGWSVSGMETIFFAALVVTFLHLYLFTSASRPATFAVLGLVVLCRSEGTILLAMVLAREMLRMSTGRGVRDLGWALILAVAPLIALLAFNFVYYDAILPHSYYFKRVVIYYSPSLVAQLAGLTMFWIGYYPAYVLLAVVAISSVVRSADPVRDGVMPLSFLTLYAALSFISFVAGPASDMQRYTVHLLPVIAVLALAGGIRLLPRFELARTRTLAMRVVALILFAGAFSNAIGTAEQFNVGAEQQQARRQMAAWLRTHARSGELIASADLGEIAYDLSDFDFVDVSGLTSRGFAEASQTGPAQMLALFEQKRPSYFADTAYVADTAPFGDPALTGRAVARPDGDAPLWTGSEAILANPAHAFRNVPAYPPMPAQPPFVTAPVLTIRAGGRAFMITKVGWSQDLRPVPSPERRP